MMHPLLAVDNLSVHFPLAGAWASALSDRPRYLDILSDVSLDIAPGETIGLVGESGSGKTTLARSILGLVPHHAGTVAFDGRRLERKADWRALRRHTAMVFQDPAASLSPRLRIGTLLTEPFVIHGVRLDNRSRKAQELLALVGLSSSFVDRFPHELSGGQARRVAVARALALHPRLVVADEPTAGLDVSVQGDILNLMASLKRSLSLSYIIVTHNLAMVRHVSNRLAIMYLGRLLELGPTLDVFRKPLHPYTRTLIDSEPVPDPRRRRADIAIKGEIPSLLNRPKACEFHTRCPIARDLCRTTAPQFRELSAGRWARCHFPLQ
jgi:peptide/nickel transport system ATP-binding protein